MNSLSAVLLSLTTFCIIGPEEPFAVVFDSHILDPSARAGTLNLQWQFDHKSGEAKPVLDHSQLVPKQFRSLWRLGKERDIQLVSGTAHYFNRASGGFRYVRFSSAPSRKAFDQFVGDECARRTSVKMAGTKSRFTITSPPEPATDDRPAISWHDASFSYDDGLFAYGSGTSALKADFKPLVPLAKEARGKDWYMVVQPQHASDDAKRAYLKRYVPRWAMLMQKRDAEGDAKHKSRNTKFGLYRAALEAIVKDSESVKCGFQAPRDNSGYEIDGEIMFRKGTPSAVGIRRMLPPRSRIASHPDGVLASVVCNVVLPAQVKDFLGAAAAVSENSLLTIVLDHVSRSDVMSSHFQIQRDPNSSALSASGQIPWSPDQQLADLVAVLENAAVDSGKIAFPVPIITDEPYTVTAGLHRKNTSCQFSITQGKEPQPTTATKVGTRGTILSARLDFEALANASEPNGDAIRILELLEETYHSDVLTVMHPSQTIVPEPLKSLLPKLSGEGDWTAQLDVKVVGERGLRIRVRIGRELYGLLQARKRHSRDARERSRRR